MAFTTLDIAVCIGVVAAVLFVLFRNYSRLPYPPGPKGLPIIGSVFVVPKQRQWVTYKKWSDELGEL